MRKQNLERIRRNTGQRGRFSTGAKVALAWHPDHTVMLDAAQDAEAGVIRESDA